MKNDRNFDGTCNANIRERHPDGTPRSCMKRGVYVVTTEAYGTLDLCLQHMREAQTGADIMDPGRARMTEV